METVICRSIEFSGAYNDSTGSRCTPEKHNDLLGPEPTTEPLTSCLCVPVPSTQKVEVKGPSTRAKSRLAATIFPKHFSDPDDNAPPQVPIGNRVTGGP